MIFNFKKYFRKSCGGFTLLELLIVIGILAIVGTVIVMILNPSEIFKQSRDTLRTTDLKAIDTAIRAYKEYGDIFKTSNIVQSDPSNAVIGLVRQDCTGYSNCFTSLAAWQAAFGGINFGGCAQGDLVCANKVAVAKIDGAWTNPDTSSVTISGWITSQNNYIKIYTTAMARHNGRWNNGKYRLVVSANGLGSFVKNIIIDGLQIKINTTSSYNRGIQIAGDFVNSDVMISNNIIAGTATNAYEYHFGIAIWDIGTNSLVKIYNNVVYNFSGYLNSCISLNARGVKYAYNNTVFNCDIGIAADSNYDSIVKNNISYNNNSYNYSYDPFNASSSNNLSGPTQVDAPGTNPQNAKLVNFVDIANGDFHLVSNDTSAKGNGINLSVDPHLPFSTDIDGMWRQSIWDIGADQLNDFLYLPYVFISLPDSNSGCVNYSLPPLPVGWSYVCSDSSVLQKSNSNGWIPIDFTKIPGNILNSLPVDPNNLVESGQYYTFVTDGKKWELTSILESDKNKGTGNIGGKDGGQYANILEIGSNLTLTPSAVKSRN